MPRGGWNDAKIHAQHIKDLKTEIVALNRRVDTLDEMELDVINKTHKHNAEHGEAPKEVLIKFYVNTAVGRYQLIARKVYQKPLKQGEHKLNLNKKIAIDLRRDGYSRNSYGETYNRKGKKNV